MATHIARGGRRRRVLNEEARAAAGAQVMLCRGSGDDASAPRYGELAGVEHHPQISDFVPRRKRAALATLVGGAAIGGGALAVSHGATQIAAFVPGLTAAQIGEQLAGGVVAWTSAVALLAIAGLARLAYALRRHRVDDVRGRYRVWRWVGGAALVLSVNAVVGAHAIVASAVVAATGWSLTTGGAEWWLAPTALLGAWLAARLTVEVGESRSSLALMVAAGACYGVAGAGCLGWSPALLGAWSDALTRAVPLVGHAFALAGMLWFARYVVLDVQGLIDHAPRPAAKAARRDKAVNGKAPAATLESPGPATIPARREPGATPAAHWDGEGAADGDGEDESAGQFLSKSERKRLRKQQQQRRAA